MYEIIFVHMQFESLITSPYLFIAQVCTRYIPLDIVLLSILYLAFVLYECHTWLIRDSVLYHQTVCFYGVPYFVFSSNISNHHPQGNMTTSLESINKMKISWFLFVVKRQCIFKTMVSMYENHQNQITNLVIRLTNKVLFDFINSNYF